MTSSGMKRGLATVAVSALAVTGLPALAGSAYANSLAEQAGGDNATVLYTPEDLGFASVKNDGVNTTVHLLANGGANVIQVQFQYSDDAGVTWKNIGSPVSRANGAFSTEWSPSTDLYNLPTTKVRAQGLTNVATPIASPDTNTVTVSSGAESIDIGNAPGSAVGVYIDPNSEWGAVSGTTSDVAADPSLTFNSPSATTGTTTTEDVVGTPAGGVRSYSAPVDFAGYAWDTTPADGTVDQAVVYAEAQGSDAEAVTLYKQTIGEVTAVAVPTNPQSGGTSTVTVTVTDQSGKPVAGADVIQEGGAEKQTNSQGKATFTVTDTNASGGTTFSYFVDENGDNTYNAGDEFRRSVTVSDYTPAATSLAGDSHDGAAFDLDEYTVDNGAGEGDLTVTVKDQNGAPLKGQTLTGKWTITPFDATAPATTVNATITDGDNDGVYNVALPGGAIEGTYKLDAWIEKDGTPGETAGDLAMTPLVFKAGQAEINWADGATAQRPAGTTATFEAAMQLDDGTGLPGRNVAITWTKNATGNAVVAAQAAQPTGTTRTGDSTASSKTDADGEFAVAISDPAATPNVDELNGTLDATGVDTAGIGNSAAPSTPSLDVDFLADSAVSTTSSTATQDALSADNEQSPGRPVAINLVIKNAAGTLLTDVPVSATTDHGFFTTPDATTLSELKPDPAAAEGANYGEWENLGTTTTTETDDSGKARVVVAIERDAGFDDDGQVTAKVTFTVGGKTITSDVLFDSSDPMNPGTVSIELAPDAMQTVTVLPKAPTTERVAFYAKATDQYGNLTDVTLKLSDNTPLATVENAAGAEISSITSQFTNQAPGVYGDGSAPTSQVITGLWDNADTLTWTDAQLAVAGFQEENLAGVDGTKAGTKDVSDDSPAIQWYDIDFAHSVYTLQQEGAEQNTVGTAVTEIYTAIDQMGEPISGLDVVFFRAGPDDEQDGDGNSHDGTNSDGVATYTFQGESVGTARITAVPYLGGERIAAGEATDTVQFVANRVAIEALLKLKNQADGDDVAKVNAPSAAAGAKVKLFKIKKDGTRVLLAVKTANANGNAKFVVNDTKPGKVTTYKAKVGATAKTFADWTPKRSIK